MMVVSENLTSTDIHLRIPIADVSARLYASAYTLRSLRFSRFPGRYFPYALDFLIHFGTPFSGLEARVFANLPWSVQIAAVCHAPRREYARDRGGIARLLGQNVR
jgi:hypothetical protein